MITRRPPTDEPAQVVNALIEIIDGAVYSIPPGLGWVNGPDGEVWRHTSSAGKFSSLRHDYAHNRDTGRCAVCDREDLNRIHIRASEDV
jgi:hypothetical protein